MTTKIAICGCGALGSWIALFLARPEIEFLLIDDERIEEHNIATSAYYSHHVGAWKANVLAEMVWRKGQSRATVSTHTLKVWTPDKLLRSAVVVDAFDNVAARNLTRTSNTFHVGVSEDRTGAVEWDKNYTLPMQQFERGQNPVCTHHLGAPIIRFTAACAAGEIERYLATEERRSFFVTESLQIIS